MKSTARMWTIGTLGALSLLAGCGGGGGSDSPSVSPIVGMFRETGITGEGKSITCPGALSLSNGMSDHCGANDRFQFNADNTFTADVGGIAYSGTYQYENEILTLKLTAPASVAGEVGISPATFRNGNKNLIFTATLATGTTDIYTRE